MKKIIVFMLLWAIVGCIQEHKPCTCLDDLRFEVHRLFITDRIGRSTFFVADCDRRKEDLHREEIQEFEDILSACLQVELSPLYTRNDSTFIEVLTMYKGKCVVPPKALLCINDKIHGFESVSGWTRYNLLPETINNGHFWGLPDSVRCDTLSATNLALWVDSMRNVGLRDSLKKYKNVLDPWLHKEAIKRGYLKD